MRETVAGPQAASGRFRSTVGTSTFGRYPRQVKLNHGGACRVCHRARKNYSNAWSLSRMKIDQRPGVGSAGSHCLQRSCEIAAELMAISGCNLLMMVCISFSNSLMISSCTWYQKTFTSSTPERRPSFLHCSAHSSAPSKTLLHAFSDMAASCVTHSISKCQSATAPWAH